MKSLVIIVILMASWGQAQNGRGPPSLPQQQDHGHGWDIRLAVPGEPGRDYSTLGSIPRTTFSCAGKAPGYYADVEAGCQVFRVCTVGSTYGFQSFLCPNGTLFNQEVFVCDWWMNVKCRPYERLTNEKFGNLRLGPQLMKDIKKMLTHTMRNPYDKTAMKSNLIVMQDYKPPAGQLFPNGALIAGPDRTPNNVYVPSKQILAPNFVPNYENNDIAFAASTPDTRYVPAGFTRANSDAEVFQRQRQNAQYVQQNLQTTPLSKPANFVQPQPENFVQNGQLEPLIFKKTDVTNNNRQSRPHQNIQNTQYAQRINQRPQQSGQLNRHRAQYTEVKKPQLNGGKEFGSYTKQQYNQEKQPYTYKTPTPTLPNDLSSINSKELKQNLVSAAPTTVPKTLAFSRIIQNQKNGRPKSRITVKTWVVKSNKSGRLIAAEPSAYTYEKPTQSPSGRIVEDVSPYVYDRPTNPPPGERQIIAETAAPYVYNRPTTPKPERVTEDVQPYIYNRPTLAPRQAVSPRSEPSRAYIPPSTTSRPQDLQRAKISLTPSILPPTQSSRVYLAPTTFKPVARLYLPPENPPVLSRQYLSPLQQVPDYQFSQLRAVPTTPAPSYTHPSNNNNNNNPSYSVSQQPRSNFVQNRHNLTFTDILTKEKLDLTVNDIVKDTGSILQTASPPQYSQYRQDLDSITEPEDKYLPAEDNESGENLTSQSPTATTASKSARIIEAPSRSLEPPTESFSNGQNTNQIAMLPFFKESSVPNTIERTVSLKITIPERIASFIFRGGNESDYDNLEILNTGSSNYLVLSNNVNQGDFIPIGKLNANKNSNVSNSQALVFSFLADSLNAAKKYSSIVKQDVQTSTSTQAPQLQNLNNEDLSHITNKISQLTSSQYSVQNNFNSANIAPTQTTTTQTEYTTNEKYTNSPQNQNQPIQSAQYNIASPFQTQKTFSLQFETDNTLNDNLFKSKPNQIYSGQLYQLPVPEVSQIYNQPQSANIIQTSSIQKSVPIKAQNSNQNNDEVHNNLVKQSSAEIEIVQSESLPLSPAKLQLAPTNEPESFYSQESWNNLLNTDNGISAQLQDKIVGVIPHPIEDNKLLTYEKDQSYYLYTKLDNGQNVPQIASTTNNNLKPISRPPNVITFQFVPSVSYQLEDDKEQQKILNTFRIDEFGAPRDVVRANLVQDNQRGTIVSNIDYTIDHTPSKQVNADLNTLYNGPSSYSAPQGSIGNLKQTLLPNNLSSRLEELDSNSNSNGYPKSTPTRRFVF